jgi:hypothetical protein
MKKYKGLDNNKTIINLKIHLNIIQNKMAQKLIQFKIIKNVENEINYNVS